MGNQSNVNRKACAKTLTSMVATLKKTSGLTIQAHRCYKGAVKKNLTQPQLAGQSQTQQTIISQLENGTAIPGDALLHTILQECGFNMAPGEGGDSLYKLLRVVRDVELGLKKIEKQMPA